MLDKILSTCESFDWMTPLADLSKDMSSGGHTDIIISGSSPAKVKRLLKAASIKTWGVDYRKDGRYSVRVKSDDESKALQILGIGTEPAEY